MRSEFETGLAGQSDQAWLLSFDSSGDELAAAALMRWSELKHIDPPHCAALKAQADQNRYDDDDGDGTAASATHPYKDCHV